MPPDSPEQGILLCCARPELDPSGEMHLGRLVEQQPDWQRLARLARKHGLVPLLYRLLIPGFEANIPDAVVNRLRAESHETLLESRIQLRSTFELLDLMERARITGVPLKGPVLSSRLFDDPGLRPSVDVDIVVHPDDLPRTHELLINEEYRAKHPRIEDTRRFMARHADTAFISPDGRVHFELHWKFSREVFAFPVEVADVWPRLRAVSVENRMVLQPAVDDELLYLCAHGAKHGWSHLKWLVDVATLVGRMDDEDILQALHRSESRRRSRVLLLGLHLSHAWLGAPLPATVRERVAADHMIGALERQVDSWCFAPKNDAVAPLKPFLFQLELKDNPSDRVRYARYLIGLLRRPDNQNRPSGPAAVLTRPFELVFRTCRHLFRRFRGDSRGET